MGDLPDASPTVRICEITANQVQRIAGNPHVCDVRDLEIIGGNSGVVSYAIGECGIGECG
jgi:hypothetical protein